MHESPSRALLDAGADLLTGSRCAGCHRPGRSLCRRCADVLTAVRPRACRPDPPPVQLLRPTPLPLTCAGSYDGLLRDLVVAHKEERRLALAHPLGRLLASAVECAVLSPELFGTGVVLVPVPSSPQSVRTRGHDPLLRLTRVAATRLRRRGIACAVVPLLAHARTVADQAGLSAAARVANLEGAFTAVRCGSRTRAHREVVVVDDVVTTGASLAEAVRALRAGGLDPVAGATVAATQRRGSRHPVALSAPDD